MIPKMSFEILKKKLSIKLICFVVHILQIEENHLNRQSPCNGATENAPSNTHLPPKSPSRDILNSTGQSIATINNIDIEVQEQKHKKAKPPQPKSSNRHANKPPSLNKRRDEKEDALPPQTHPPEKVLGVERAEEKTTANGLISRSSTTHKPTDRAKSLTENKTPDVSMDLKEDTMKLLQEAAMQNIPHPEIKAETRRGSTGVADHHSMCVVRDVPVGSSTEESEVQYCEGTF